VALSADGRLMASGDNYGTVRLWEVWPERPMGRPLAVLQGHSGGAYAVALSQDGRLVASGGDDGAVRLWDVAGCRLLAALEGHAGMVRAVAFDAEGRLVASGSLDGTVKLWDAGRRSLLRTLRPDRRFERLDITGLSGVTSAQRAALLALGAIEKE
jgi:WD40 repeat protein